MSPRPTVGGATGQEHRNVDYDDFYSASVAALLKVGYARTGDWQIAEDLVQEALADAHRRWSEVGQYDDPLLWARRAVLNRAASRWRKLGSERRALTRLASRRETDFVSEPVFGDELLWAAIRGLPRRQLEVVLMLWFEELTVTETASVLGCGSDTVRTHWRRAKQRLSRELGDPLSTTTDEEDL